MPRLRENKKCWLIAEPGGRTPILGDQFARLRGLEPRSLDADSLSRVDGDSLIVAGLAALGGLASCERETLRAAINLGATLYLRGGEQGIRYQLAPLVDASFTVGSVTDPTYRFTRNTMIPAALRDEEASVGEALNFATNIHGAVESILVTRDTRGIESPVVFACRAGKGMVICDVQPDETAIDIPLIWRMADPAGRCRNASALVAVDRAVGRDVESPVAFNLTIDDIPLGYDYFNEARLEEFFAHIEGRCPEVHLDCAWIPTSQWIGRRYVEILKEHGAGFVWHGMHRHVDHQKIDDSAAEMEAGKRAMAINTRRYGMELQPVIIFPFERAHRSTEELLLNEGFLAGAEQPRHDEGAADLPEYLRYSADSCAHESGLRFLHRYEADFLTRDRMIAIAALGMPILAFAHPKDVRLRRLSRFIERGGSFSHFDEVLDFASAKGLRGRSLEAIARDVFDKEI